MTPILQNPVRQALIRPVNSQYLIGNYRITHDFGPTSNTLEPSYFWSDGEGITVGEYPHFHTGIDIGNGLCGGDVIAAKAGTVSVVGKDAAGAIRVWLDHGNGEATHYVHLMNELVSLGQKIALGQLIGHIGMTGLASACHLHFGLYLNGQPVDPWTRLAQNQEEPLIPITDQSPKSVTAKAGAVYYDPGTHAVVTRESLATRTVLSAYASGIYRVVPIPTGGTTKLLGVRTDDANVTVSAVPAPVQLKPGLYKV